MRNLSLDYLKIFLAILVVILHTKFLMNNYPELGFLLVNGVCRIAVPLFLVITGYYFYQIDSVDKLKNWSKRLGILYLIWMIFYAPFWFRLDNPMQLFLDITNGYFVLWYLFGTLIAGLLLYKFKNLSNRNLLILAGVLYFMGYILQQLGNAHVFSGILDSLLNKHQISRNFLFDCFPLLTLGFIINRVKLDTSYHVKFIHIVFMLIVLILECFLNYRYISDDQPIDFLLSLPLIASMIFLYFKNIEIKGKNKQLAFYSTAIYLIHPFVMGIYEHFNIKYNETFFVLCFSLILGIVLVFINKRFKYIL